MRSIFKKRSRDAAQDRYRADSATAPQPPLTSPAEDSILVNQDGLVVIPRSRPAPGHRFDTLDPNIEHLKEYFAKSLAMNGAVSRCVTEDLLTPLPPPNMYSRWVETQFFLSRIEELVIATDPKARYAHLNRLRKYYDGPIVRLFDGNSRRAQALRAQMEELQWLMDKADDLPFPQCRSGSLPSFSNSSSGSVDEIEESDIIRPLPRIAQLANEDVSVSEDAVYNRAMMRFLADDSQLSAQDRSSMEEFRSNRNRQRLANSSRLSRIPEGSERTSATRRVSHERASHFMEEIDVRPEMRDPRRVMNMGFGGFM